MAFRDQDHLARYVDDRLQRVIEQSRSLTSGLNEDERARPPDDGGWSINQILAHLARMNQAYLAELDRAAVDGVPEAVDAQPWQPTLGGRLLRWGVNTSLPMKAPRVLRPEALEMPETAEDIVEMSLTSHHRLLECMHALRGKAWIRIRVTSPASSLLKLNAGDVFLVLTEHAERHLRQIEELRDALG